MDTKRLRTAGRIFAIVLVGALMTSALTAGGKGQQGGRTNRTGSEKCVVTPNPVRANAESLTVNGSGFSPGVAYNITYLGTTLMTTAQWDGTFAASGWANFADSQLGSVTASVYPQGSRKVEILATCSFLVTAP